MDHHDILMTMCQVRQERAAAVGALEQQRNDLDAEITQRVAAFDTRIEELRAQLVKALCAAGVTKETIKTEAVTLSVFQRESIDTKRLKAMAVEIPALRQCFIVTMQTAFRWR